MPNLKIALADESTQCSRDLVTFPEFGEKLTLDQYLERELSLRSTSWAKSSMRTWVLIDENSHGSNAVLSSLETFQVTSRLASTPHKLGITELIASVVTEPKYRGHGYASQLVQKVCDQIFSEKSELQSIILYSDVKPDFYAKLGFVARPPVERIWPAHSKTESHANWIERPLRNQEIVPTFLSGEFSLELTQPVLEWHWKRQDLYAQFLNRKTDSRVGIQTRSGPIYFAADFKYDCLRVLNLPFENKSESWMNSLARLAAEWNLPRVVCWDHAELTEPWDHRLISSDLVTRANDAVPMIYPRPGTSLNPQQWTHIARAFWV